jgi:Ca-activated chloride channel family protein
MKITTQLDVNVVAVDLDDEVTIMLDLEAPAADADQQRPPASLEIVLDRSGSMTGAPLEGAKDALIALVRRLEPTDNFGLVTFDHAAHVVVPAGPTSDKEEVIAQIRRVTTGGSTDLGAGLLRGLRELKRAARGGGTLLVVSDGHVNAGLRDVNDFAGVAEKAHMDGIVISTLGYGEHYDETLLTALARSGSGNHVFANDPDAASAAIAGEVAGLLAKALQAVTLTVVLRPAVEMVRLYNDLPGHALPGGRIMIEIGDLYASEKRRLLMKLKVPGMADLGSVEVATLELEYIELPRLIQHAAKLPVGVNIVPGTDAARRLVHPVVESELLFQEAQHAKRLASEAFERHEVGSARAHLVEAKSHLSRALSLVPVEAAAEFEKEIASVDRMTEMASERSTEYMSKLSRSSYHQMNRKRGRTDNSGIDGSGAV